jgi:hypothetical protein
MIKDMVVNLVERGPQGFAADYAVSCGDVRGASGRDRIRYDAIPTAHWVQSQSI